MAIISRPDQNKKTDPALPIPKFTYIPLKLVLIVPFVALITGAVGLVGYLSYRSGQEAVTNLANQLMDQASNRVVDRLDTSLKPQQQLLAFSYNTFQQGKFDLNNPQQLQSHFWQQINSSPNLSALTFGNEQGKLVGYRRIISRELAEIAIKISGENIDVGTILLEESPISKPSQRNYSLVDSQGKAKKMIVSMNNADPRTTDWYIAAKNAQRQVWSPIYIFRAAPTIGISSVIPIYDADHKLQGVWGSAITLSEISTFLENLHFSSSGQAFIMERSGNLVATSTLEVPYTKQENGEPLRLAATKSQDHRTRAIATYLQQKYGSLNKINDSQYFQVVVNGVNIFANVKPYQDTYGLDWLLVTATPEADFMGEIQANTRWTFLLCGMTLLTAIGMGLSTARWVVKPIRKLSRSSQAIAGGDWQSLTPVDIEIAKITTQRYRITEIETLANSFKQMLVQLQDSHHEIAESLHHQELESKGVLSLIPDLIFVNNIQGLRVRQLQTNYQQETSLLTEDREDEYLWHILPAELVSMRLHYIYKAIQTGEIQTYEQQVDVRGKLQDEEVRIIKISDQEVLVMIRDITDRKQIEIALRTSEEKFRHAFEDASIGMAIVSLDGHWLKVNPALCQLIGYSPKELLGLTSQDITHPEDVGMESDYGDQLLAGKTSTYQIEKRYIHKQGSIIWVLLNVSLVRNEHGDPLHFISQFQDTTTRKEAQKALELQSFIMNNMAGSVCLVKISDRKIVYTNPKFDAMFGYPEGDLIGQSVRILNYLDNQLTPGKSYLDVVTQIEESGETKYEVQNRKKDGTLFWCRVHSSRFEHPEYGTVYISVQDDITELKLAERELTKAKEAAEAANHTKSRFIANMSHELRTPLNAILGFSQLMQSTPHLPVEHYENAEIIHRSGNYLLSLINNILDLSKIEADKTTLNIQEFSMHSLLNELREMLQLRVNKAGLSMIFECSPEVPPYIFADDIKLQQILINLLSNAIKFTQQGEIILRVGCSSPSSSPSSSHLKLHFSIQDSGVGITPEELLKIFEPFNQAEAGRELQEGTGLGLTISRKFVQLMGGEIVVTSELGQGTTFQFQIPVQQGQGLVEPKVATHQKILGLAPGQPQYKILVVDDIEVNRKLLIKILSPLGFQVQEASNGQEAIALWESWQPHLIWMDLRMPIMDGYTTTKHIRAKGSKTTIIALTADIREDNRATVLAAGCDDFYTKPFAEQTIFAALSQHLGVSYIYAEEPTVSLEPERILTTEDFASMPLEWLQQVYDACLVGNFDLVIELTTEIPTTASFFAKSLEDLADQFDSETIVKLIQPLI
jgi:PAS domain S-box-containing protein